MRVTITLDADVAELILALSCETGVSFKVAVNEAIRAGLGPPLISRFLQRSFAMGTRAEIDYDHALRLAAALEDQELIRELAR